MKKIPAFRLVPQPQNEEAANLKKFQWAAAHIGTRHRLGGEPEFIQEAYFPSCPDCGEQMTFLAQIDSINDEFILGDCGIVYLFVCFDCNTSDSFIQCY